MWFTVGAAFSLVTLTGVSLMLLWDSTDALTLPLRTSGVNGLLQRWLFGTTFLFPRSVSILDASSMIISTMLSVGVHEFGHGIAAASEGLRIEYIAVFLAICFPGALVAFDYDWLQSLPQSSALRIYCAGIWHNITFSAACFLTLISLPVILHPFYLYGQGPLVLAVPKVSPLYGYLSPYDVIVSVDGSNIKSPHEWINIMANYDSQILPEPSVTKGIQTFEALSHIKGYCVPDNWIKASSTSCGDELADFVYWPCNNSRPVFDNIRDEMNKSESKHCLIARDVVKCKKCWSRSDSNFNGSIGRVCDCLEDETCMTPVQIPGMSWVEVTYSSPYSSQCSEYRSNASTYSENFGFDSTFCGGTFVFIGDALSLAHSIHLSAYQPRWIFTAYMAHMPDVLEKFLACCFRISASLALVNSLPVFFLDGESILEIVLCYFTFLKRRPRLRFLRFCLVGGTILSIISFSRLLYFMIVARE
ncbi:membrane-bound transcription factor site-2 protease homolog isoform X2 [Zingiber officinale]|nr:membrane-bound transcription factor site-2 protease homolog isoform X2 [Zingiber officinale]